MTMKTITYIQPDSFRIRKFNRIANAIRSCETRGEVSRIIAANIDFASENPELFRTAKLARRRIHTKLREHLENSGIIKAN